MRLQISNFRGIRKGSLELERLNILIGSNNSGKTTILEALFLAPNPIRYVAYGSGYDYSAVSVLSYLHSTLGSEAYVFLLHNYTERLAGIACTDLSKEVKVWFQRGGNRIEVYVEENNELLYFGYLGSSNKSESILGSALLGQRDSESGRLMPGSRTRPINPRYFISEATGESFYFHPLLMKLIWGYLKDHWVEFRSKGLTSRVAKRISEGVAGDYDDLLLEPFIGGTQTIYVRTKDARGIRLGDLGSGVQVLTTLMLIYEFLKPRMLLIDDIESHMNPMLLTHVVSWFAEILKNDTMLVVSTHSLEAAKFIAGALEEFEPQIVLLSLREGKLRSRNLSLDEVEELEKAGIDVRVGEGILI